MSVPIPLAVRPRRSIQARENEHSARRPVEIGGFLNPVLNRGTVGGSLRSDGDISGTIGRL